MAGGDEKLAELWERAEELELPPMLPRKWHQIRGSNPTTLARNPALRIMQWNILAQCLSQGENNFVRCPAKALEWKVRHIRVLEEILSISPDIACLQEVDTFSHLALELENAGYEGFFYPKHDSPCLKYPNSMGPDGCAIFYRKATVTLQKSENVDMFVGSDEKRCNHVALMATFTQKGVENPTPFHVICTHLKAKDEFYSLRENQAKFLISYIRNKLDDAAVVVCGDFNDAPSEPAYEVFRTSDLRLDSVYKQLDPALKEPPYTTWKIRGDGEKVATIDYIWASREWFQVESLLTIPTAEAIGPDKLPNLTYPSDHIALAATLSLGKKQ